MSHHWARKIRQLGHAVVLLSPHLVRPYVRRGVLVRVTDPDDPTPYWLVSSRHPRTLAAALAAGVVSAPTDRAD